MITATKITYAGPAMSKDMGGAAFCAWVAALTFFALATDQVSPFIAEAFVPVVIVISTVFAVLALGSTVSAVHLTRAGRVEVPSSDGCARRRSRAYFPAPGPLVFLRALACSCRHHCRHRVYFGNFCRAGRQGGARKQH